MLKNHFFCFAAAAVIIAVVFSGCDTLEKDDSVDFIIDNQSSYDLEDVRISGKTFTTANLSFLQKGTSSKSVPLPPETGRTITFIRKDAGVECSIDNVSISIREDRYTIQNRTLVALSGSGKVELGKVLAPPSAVNVSAASSTSVTISWNPVTGAQEYYIYRSSTADGAYAKLTPAVITGTSYTDSDLPNGASYYYKVTAKNADYESGQSNAVSAVTIPSAPSPVSASAASSSGITVSWNPVTGAQEYFIYRSSTADGAYAKLTTTPAAITGTSYTDTGLFPRTAYYYKVAASNSGGVGEQSGAVSATTLLAPPSPVSATAASSSGITVSWNPVTGAQEYFIYRSSTADGAYAKLTTTPAAITGTSYTDMGLSVGTAYYYKVAASNSGGAGEQSGAVSALTIPDVPSPVSAVTASSSSITVSWSAVTGAQEYYIYRSSTADGAYAKLTTTAAITGTSYTDTGLSSNTAYYYKVAARNSVGAGEQSISVSATTLIALLSPPSSVIAVAASSSSITVSWNAVTGAQEYYIYRATSADGSYTYLTNITSTSYTDTALSSGATYYYKVAAYNSSGVGSMSSSYGYATTSVSYIDINDTYWHTYTLSAGASQYYRIYVTAGTTRNIVWKDYDYDSSLCDILVSASWQSGGAEIFSPTDGGVRNDEVRIKSFYASSSGYVILKVEGFSASSTGNYSIGCYDE
ncbi:MAG: fibronectin type III domain-containing protein [Treponema sp.]|nr:fibronectin type III domain-containing protein [Treponema sp.]